MKWVENHIEVDPPKRPKKLTGTRFASILGLNPWSSPFEIWCEVTRTYQEPFEDTIYTVAGKTIEPKQIAYMKKAYVMDNLRTPTDIFGENFFNKTYGDFFHEVPIFGGMWDSILVDDGEKTEAVLEFKTTKRSEDWAKDVPEYYALQAALYAYLLGVDDVIMVASFLESKDYDTPEKFKPSAKNTITVEFKVSERYPNFDMMVEKATKWWNDHVLTGISPDYDEKKDAEILKALRTNNLSPDTDIDALISEAEGLKTELDEAAAKVADKEKRLKEINDVLKEHAMTQFRDGDKKVEIKGSRYTWAVSRSETSTVDKDALKADGLLDKYTKKSTQYRMTVK
jgi:predicted phage-related endonuclease